MQSWCLPRGIHNQAREINIPVMDLLHHARVQHMSLKQCFLIKINVMWLSHAGLTGKLISGIF